MYEQKNANVKMFAIFFLIIIMGIISSLYFFNIFFLRPANASLCEKYLSKKYHSQIDVIEYKNVDVDGKKYFVGKVKCDGKIETSFKVPMNSILLKKEDFSKAELDISEINLAIELYNYMTPNIQDKLTIKELKKADEKYLFEVSLSDGELFGGFIPEDKDVTKVDAFFVSDEIGRVIGDSMESTIARNSSWEMLFAIISGYITEKYNI